MTRTRIQQPTRPALGVTRRRMRHAAWLALVSMLLIFVGPLYSNSQALLDAQTQLEPPPGFDPYAPGAFCGEVPTLVADAHKAPDDIPMHHAECGYCVLLTHASPLTPAVPDLTEPPFWSSQQPLAVQQATYNFHPYGIAQVRAPPPTTV